MTLPKYFLACLLSVGFPVLVVRGAETPDPLPQSSPDGGVRASGGTPLLNSAEELRRRYSPTYRPRPLYPARPGSRFVPTERFRPDYRSPFLLDRYRAVPQTPPPYYYRRMTPYYDGRGYGVPSTSPFRYRRDLDGPIGPRRRW